MEMETTMACQLVGFETHGFRTMADLDVPTMMEEANSRWFRPNEIHAILWNYNLYFSVFVKPIKLPKSGTIVLFDRKKLRSFRKDGHNWKKKKDGKTVKEAHEHLKIGKEELIHVYYAHGEDTPSFVRRCYWLLDKTQEHIVLVHYRKTQEAQGSTSTPMYTSPGSGLFDPPVSWHFSENANTEVKPAYYSPQGPQLREANVGFTITNHQVTCLSETNSTLGWDHTRNSLITTEESHQEMRPSQAISTLGCDELMVPDNYYSEVDTAERGSTSFSEPHRHQNYGYGFNVSHPLTRLPAQNIEAARSSIASNFQDNMYFQPSNDELISSDVQWNEPESVKTVDTTQRFYNFRQDGFD